MNLCAPEPLTNKEMMHAMRQRLGAKIGLPAPAPLLEFGAFFLRTETELIIKTRRVIPGKLLDDGFPFHFPTFQRALEDLLSPHNPEPSP